MSEILPMTPRGAARLRAELHELTTVKRPAIVQAIAEAREHGDLKENAEYHIAREDQSMNEARISYIEGMLSSGQIIDVTKLNTDTVVFGCLVTVLNIDTEEEITYRIVGEDEGDVKRGRISYRTPIARALIGKGEGDEVVVTTSNGKINLEIIGIEYNNEDIDAE